MRPEVAQRRIQAFRERFGEAHFALATHAAFPLALTPDLLYQLWANFQQNIHGEVLNIPWLAVSDILLSKLCDEVGHELYEMPKEVRNNLLIELKANSHFGSRRINELSDFLLAHVKQQLESHDPDIRDFAQTQRWTALAYLRPNQTFNEIRNTLSKLKYQERSEIIRMASLVETLLEPLEGFEALLVYVRNMLNFRETKSEAINISKEINIKQQDKIGIVKDSIKISSHEDNSQLYDYRKFKLDSELLYSHFLLLRNEEDPNQLIDRFRQLFIDGVSYPNVDILSALYRIINSEWADKEFEMVLNRCCYIFINYWWFRPEFKESTIELINLLDSDSLVSIDSSSTNRLRKLVKEFHKTEQYKELKNRAQIIEGFGTTDINDRLTIKDLVLRYPFLYPHCLPDWKGDESVHLDVKDMQARVQKKFEQSLLQYGLNLLRDKRDHSGQSRQQDPSNPTLLNTKQAEFAIKMFSGKAEGNQTYQDIASQFITQINQLTSHREVKQKIYEYLITSIENSGYPDYGKHRFNYWLSKKLESILPKSDNLRSSRSLLLQTCFQLLDSLVASPNQTTEHLVFVDLVNNLGATCSIGMLLKLTMLCRENRSSFGTIKIHLDRRFAILLKHYEEYIGNEAHWLVECLENWFIASTIHFGQTDFSWFKSL